MATSFDLGFDSSFNKICDELACPICQDRLKFPKSLDCLHCVCEECLLTLISTALNEDWNSFKCPTCSRLHEIRPEKANAYKTHFILDNLIGILEKYEAKKE